MALINSIDWAGTSEILINRADMPVIQVSPEVRSLDTDLLLSELKDQESSADGMPWTDTQRHNSEYTIGGITYAQSIEIIDPYFITFEDGQYSVSLSGSNNNIIEVASANQVRILANNSAGLINPQAINYLNQYVWVDPSLATDGVGTQQSPFNSITSALDYAGANNIRLIRVLDDLTLDRNVNGLEILGIGEPEINFGGFGVGTSTLKACKLTGTLGGPSGNSRMKTEQCTLDSIINLDGIHFNPGLRGNNTLVADADCTLDSAFSRVAGLGRPTVSMNATNTGSLLSMRRYSGGLSLADCNNAGNEVTLEVGEGRVELLASCTLGTISVRGHIDLIDNSAGSTVEIDAYSRPTDIANTKALAAGLYSKR